MRRGAGWNLHPAGMILSVGVARLLTGALLGFRPFDDTFITFRYAKNIGEGFGFVYNAGEQVLGTTTPLWALVLASLSAAGLPMDEASLVVSLIADVVSALFLWLLLTRLGYARPVAVGAAVLFLCIFDAFSLARSGMECSLFVALVTGTLAAAASNRVRTAGLLCGLACLTRPEGVVLIPILLCWGWTARSRLARRDLVAAVGLCILVAVPWVAFAMGRFGSVVPQSVLAKAAATHSDASLAAFSWTNLGLFLVSGQYGGDIFARTLWQLNFVLALLGLWAAASLLSTSLGRPPRSVEPVLLLLAFPACYTGGLALAHAFTYYPWYYGPLYPSLAVLAMVGASRLAAATHFPAWAVCAVLVAGQGVAAVHVKIPRDRDFWIEGYRRASAGIPPSASVLVAAPEIGVVGWEAWPAPILDLVGLVTPAAVGIDPAALLQRSRPGYLVVRTDNAAALLAAIEEQNWFRSSYRLQTTIQDPYQAREFRCYERVGP